MSCMTVIAVDANQACGTAIAMSQVPIVATRYKTKMCRNFIETGACPYESRCMFAHGDEQVRSVEQNVADGLISEEAVKSYKKKQQAEAAAKKRKNAKKAVKAAKAARTKSTIDSSIEIESCGDSSTGLTISKNLSESIVQSPLPESVVCSCLTCMEAIPETVITTRGARKQLHAQLALAVPQRLAPLKTFEPTQRTIAARSECQQYYAVEL